MKKAISFVQKYAYIAMLVLFGLLAIFAVSMATPTANCASYAGTGKEWISKFYQTYQLSNDIIVYIAIAGIILAFLYKGLRSGIRKIYYVGNFVSSFLLGGCAVFGGVYTLISVINYQKGYASLPIDDMNAYWADHKSSLSMEKSPIVFPLGYILSAILILAGLCVLVLFVYKMINRIKYENARAITTKEAN